jgi:hypothetical protein
MTSFGLFYLISKHDKIKDSISKKQEKDQHKIFGTTPLGSA